MGDKMDSVASSTKWTVLPIAPDEFQEVEVPPFSWDTTPRSWTIGSWRFERIVVPSVFQGWFPGLEGRGPSGRRETLYQRRGVISRDREALKQISV